MLETLHSLYLGFNVATIPVNLLFCFVGALIGTAVGVLPGLGPGATISLLLPVTLGLRPDTAVIMLAGIFHGAQYGGSITSILLNIPGEASTVVTCLDGHQMARQGRAGAALGISAIGSFIGASFSLVVLALLAAFIASFALRFGPPEYFALMSLATIILVFLGKGSIVKSFVSAVFGFFLGTIGIDYIYGVERFTFESLTLSDGVGLVPVAMGLFGIGEVLVNLEEREIPDILKTKLEGLLPTMKDWRESIWPIIRGSVLGFFLGILPGSGPVLASFTSYAVEKRISRHPESFGSGAIAGVAGPETANNASSVSSMIPLLSLGIPSNLIMALLLGAMMMHGVAPSCLLFKENPDLFWGVIASLYIGNFLLLLLNLPLIGIWVQVLRVPYRILFPVILFVCIIGAYSVNSNPSEVLIMLIFGGIGYLMRKTGFEAAPLLFAMIVSPVMEAALRRSLALSRGNFSIFFTRPISLVLISAAFILLIVCLLSSFKRFKNIIATRELDRE